VTGVGTECMGGEGPRWWAKDDLAPCPLRPCAMGSLGGGGSFLWRRRRRGEDAVRARARARARARGHFVHGLWTGRGRGPTPPLQTAWQATRSDFRWRGGGLPPPWRAPREERSTGSFVPVPVPVPDTCPRPVRSNPSSRPSPDRPRPCPSPAPLAARAACRAWSGSRSGVRSCRRRGSRRISSRS
jgi:hypothetical protein